MTTNTSSSSERSDQHTAESIPPLQRIIELHQIVEQELSHIMPRSLSLMRNTQSNTASGNSASQEENGGKA